MDLSGLKWPIIIAVVVGVIWLGTSGGVSFMVNNFTKAVPGENPGRDKTDEAGLTRIGGYLMMTFRYGWAIDVMETAMDRYPDGANRVYNYYRTAKCYEKLDDYGTSVSILQKLIDNNAHELDDRIPDNDVLRLRMNKLIEVNGL